VAVDTADGRFATRSWLRAFSTDATVPTEKLNAREIDDAAVLCVMIRSVGACLIDVERALRAQLDRIRYTSSASGLLECSAPNATKAHAVDWASAQCGSSLGRLVAFGDMPNDLEMLKSAALSAAVANASPSVLSSVDVIASSNDDDGVATTLSSLMESECL
jgi:hydroxymethylpyrimidine pyrophosphatase-like HAD family hydrolase